MKLTSWVLSIAAICAIWFTAGVAVGFGLDDDYTFRGVALVASLIVFGEVVKEIFAGRAW